MKRVSINELKYLALLATCYGEAEEVISITKMEEDLEMVNYGEAEGLILEYRRTLEQGSAFLNKRQRTIHAHEIRRLEQIFEIQAA